MSADAGWLALLELFRLLWELGALAVMTIQLMQDSDGRLIMGGLVLLVGAITAVLLLIAKVRRNRASPAEPTGDP